MIESLVLIGGLLMLIAMGTPVVFAMVASSLVTILVFRSYWSIELIAVYFTNGVQQFPLLALAFFFLVGEWMNAGGITKRIVVFANAVVGRVRGGLAQTNVMSSMLFAGISGSAVADTAALGSVLIPSMKRSGYDAGFAAAVTQTSAVIGPIIPPSIPMIIFAFLAEVSVGRMFLGGVVPGVLVGLGLMAMAYIISRRRNYPVERDADAAAVLRAFGRAILPLLAPAIILGGILGGVFTATEAGAVAAVYAFVIGKFVYRELTWLSTWEGVVRAAMGTAQVLIILGAATLFAFLIVDLRISQPIADGMLAISSEPWAFMLMLALLLIIVGLFLENIPAMVILVPIFYPISTELGIDPIHFGVLVVMATLVGLCTPPVGILIYMSAKLGEVGPETVIRESLPFIAVLIAMVVLVALVPTLTLALPDLSLEGAGR